LRKQVTQEVFIHMNDIIITEASPLSSQKM